MAVGCDTLQALAELIGDCCRCPLSRDRTHVVFGAGDPHARLVIIGEAPGKSEDLTGEPFVGSAGTLLDELLASIGLDRTSVYIANIVKCRPPHNRDPLTLEVETCTPFLAEQLRLIAPDILVTLGNYATRFVLKTPEGITGLRGQVHDVGAYRVLPVFHPAAALYDRSKRAVLFADFAVLGDLLLEGQS